MIDSLVERLRNYGRRPHVICKEAADRIEELEAALNQIVELDMMYESISHPQEIAEKALKAAETARSINLPALSQSIASPR